MNNIYGHVDSEGDSVFLRECTPLDVGDVKLLSSADVRFTREDIFRLREALTVWLGDGPTPVLPNNLLTEDAVRLIVRDELNKATSTSSECIWPGGAESVWLDVKCTDCPHWGERHGPETGCVECRCPRPRMDR